MSILYDRDLKYDWKLFKMDKIMSDKYFDNYKKSNELEYIRCWKNNVETKTLLVHPNIINNFNANHITYGNLKKTNCSFFDIIDNKEYDVFNVVMLSPHIIVFFFNVNNPCFLIQNYCYMDFFYFGRIKRKIITEISLSTSGNQLDLEVIQNNLNFIYNIGINNKITNLKKKMYLFGMLSNIGHHLWNEVSGILHFLDNKKNIEFIDAVTIGPYDFFNMEKYLNDNGIKTAKYNVNQYPIVLNVYPVLMNSIIFNGKCKPKIKRVLNYSPQIVDCLQIKRKQIVFDIRSCSRVILNIIEVFSYVINNIYKLIGDKYILNIVFTGRFTTHLNNINIVTDQEILDQNNIVNKITGLCNNTNIIFDNLIGKKFTEIANHISNADLMILMFGTSSPNLISWIFDTKCIVFVQPINYHTYKNISACFLDKKNWSNIPDNCFDCFDNHNIIVNQELFYEYLYTYFLKKM
jgi:hypothetical protein